MHGRLRRSLAPGRSLAVGARAGGRALSEEQTTPSRSVEDEALEANAAFYRAFNEKDPEAMARVWSENAPVVCIHPGWNVLKGRASVLESWNGILANPAQPRLVTGGASARVFGETAVVVCRELVAGTPLAATNLFTLEEGRWRMVHHHSGPVTWIEASN